MSDDNTPDDYEIGYGKPPKDTQFQKGASGNLKGRPKKARGFDHELLREAESFITINENGQRKRITKHGVALKQLLKQAMTGNIPATKSYLDYYRQALERAALFAPSQPGDYRKYRAEDLTDDQLAEIILRAEEETKKNGE